MAGSSRDLFKFGSYIGYFSPRDNNLSEIYDGGNDAIFGLKMGVHVWNGFYIWLSGMQYKKVSDTSFLDEITRLTINPLNLSLRYTYKWGSINPYAEIGYTYLFFKEEANIGNVEGEGKGFSLDGGLEFWLSARFIVDFGIRYSQVKVSPTGDEIDLGGLQFGLAFLVVF